MRLDALVASKTGVSRTKAARFIEEGRVFYRGVCVDKPSKDVPDDAEIELREAQDFASVGGDKLEKALNDFGASVEGAICADIGASNGGFTDCLLRRGAAKVFAVDVGECALPERLKDDPRVVVKDRLNARYITPSDLGEPCDGRDDRRQLHLTQIDPSTRKRAAQSERARLCAHQAAIRGGAGGAVKARDSNVAKDARSRRQRHTRICRKLRLERVRDHRSADQKGQERRVRYRVGQNLILFIYAKIVE